MMRTKNGKGVTIPSQIRYVNYFEYCLKQNIKSATELKNQRLVLRAIHLYNAPAKCNPSFKIKSVGDKKLKDYIFDSAVSPFFLRIKIFLSRKQTSNSMNISLHDYGKKTVITVNEKLVLSRDFLTIFLFGKKEVFKFWLNSNFIDTSGIVQMEKDMIDDLWKDKEGKIVGNNFKIEVLFSFQIDTKPKVTLEKHLTKIIEDI